MKKMFRMNLIGLLLVAVCLMTNSKCPAQDTTVGQTLDVISSEFKAHENGRILNGQNDRNEMDNWDLMKSFSLTSGGQQGIVSNGNYIYTCSWMAHPSGGYSFYKYNLDGYFVEGFNIAGAKQIRDMTYDGEYFYGSRNTNYIYVMDLEHKSFIDSISTTCNNIQHISYDPDHDGFWVGYWYTLKLVNRSGQTIFTAPAPNGAHSSGYYEDANNVKHLYLFCEPNDNALVYDYNITSNIMGSSPIFDFATVPGYSNVNGGGLAGGCYVGPYQGKMAFFGNVQQNPNLVGILELRDATPPASGYTTVVLTAGDVWGDGTGYQMLLDADANTYGSVIPTSGGLTSSGDASPEVYAQFEYKIPENADGAMNTQNIVFNSSVAIQIPSGVYDWCITNPSPNDRIWIASSNGNIGGRQNDYFFEPNKTYEFVVTLQGQNDAVNVTITDNMSYMISTSVDPQNSGSVSGGGIYQEGSTCTLTATANTGYTFVKWTRNGIHESISPTISFTVTENASYVAHFTQEAVTCQITTISDPEEGGVTTGGGSYAVNTPCTITAIPNPGYEFENWTKGQGVVDTEPTHTFIVTTNANYVAHFTQTQSITFSINAVADPTEGGTVIGGGNYIQGETCTLTATPNFGYRFANWTKDGIIVSEGLSFTFTVTENATYVAHFVLSGGYAISASANPTDGGTVTGAGIYAQGLNITLTATPNEGYRFVNWTENGVIQCQTDQYEFVVDRNRILMANFEALPTFTITAMADPNGTISQQGDVQVSQGGDATFTITANFGSKIKQVLIDDLDIGPVATYTFVNVNRNHTIYAKFSGLDVDENQTNGFHLYPNPADDKVTVEGDDISLIGIYDMVGCKLYDVEVTSKSVTIPSGAFPSGIYFVEVVYSNGRRVYQRLVVVH